MSDIDAFRRVSDIDAFMAGLPSRDAGIGPGAFMAIVGPSGAGKDSLIDYVRAQFDDNRTMLVARRLITRPADAGGEAHEAVTPAEFANRQHTGTLALAWQAHGLSYGIPAGVDQAVMNGTIVMANLSRSVLSEAAARYQRFVVVNVTADPAILAERLAHRGRESVDDIARRLKRAAALDVDPAIIFTLDNSGPLQAAGERLAVLLAALAAHGTVA